MTWTSIRWSEIRHSRWRREHWLGETLRQGELSWFCRRSRHPDPTQVAVLMLHGLVVSGSYFEPLVGDMEYPNRIHVPDLPGFGRSLSPGTYTSIDDMASVLGQWMDRQGLSGVVAIGNSLGCQILTRLAVSRPDLIDRYVLISPTMDPAARSIAAISLRAIMDLPRERQSLWKIWIGDLLRAGPMLAFSALRIGLRDPQMERLSHVGQPGLVIGGERDPIVPPEWVQSMASRLGNARVIIVPGAPHALNFSASREVARIIRVVINGDGDDAG